MFNTVNYRQSEFILYNQENPNYICIIKNVFIYFCIILLLLKEIKSSLFMVLIPFFNINKARVLS